MLVDGQAHFSSIHTLEHNWKTTKRINLKSKIIHVILFVYVRRISTEIRKSSDMAQLSSWNSKTSELTLKKAHSVKSIMFYDRDRKLLHDSLCSSLPLEDHNLALSKQHRQQRHSSNSNSISNSNNNNNNKSSNFYSHFVI